MSHFFQAISAACLLYIVYTVIMLQRNGVPISLLPDAAYMPSVENAEQAALDPEQRSGELDKGESSERENRRDKPRSKRA